MSTPPAAALVAGMSGADFFGLVIALALIVYLLYALLRGEHL